MTIDDFERRLLDVDWGPSERTCFVSIPETILGILQAKPSQLELWCERLELCLLPQANLADDTPLAIPFLQELLERRVAPGCIYRTMVYITICTEDLRFGDQLGQKCRDQIKMGLDIYLRDAADSSLSIEQRSDALDVLCRLTEERAKWEPIVRGIYDAESDATLRAEILDWLNDEL